MMNGKSVEERPNGASASAWAPASLANFFHGFDAVGLALAAPRCRVAVGPAEQDSIREVRGHVEREAAWESSICGWTLSHLRQKLGLPQRLAVRVEDEIPRGCGLGSSAALAVASAKAFRALHPEVVRSSAWWCQAALEAEARFGGDHPDNVQPAFFGGLTVRHPTDPDRCLVRRPPPFFFVIGIPAGAFPRPARSQLPRNVGVADVVRSLSAVAWSLGAGPTSGFDRLADAIGAGPLEAHRAAKLPYYPAARAAAEERGARMFLSGAGPAIAAACPTRTVASDLLRAWGDLAHLADGRVLLAEPLGPLDEEALHVW